MRLIFILWVSMVAFGLPEVFAGSGRLWFARPDVYLLGLPLYGLHFLLLAHIAVRTGRTSWPALYVFGVLFALYETWVTKVVWNGYPGSGGFAMGSFGDWFGVHETLGLLLFYHPVTSFILPVVVISRLFPAFGRHFPSSDWLFGKTKGGFLLRLGLILIWGIMSGYNMAVAGDYLLTWVSMLGVLWLGYVFLKWRGATKDSGDLAAIVASPLLGHAALVVACLWLALIYVVTYLLVAPELLPPPQIQLLTLAFYPVLFVVLRIIPPRAVREDETDRAQNPARMPAFWILAVFGIGFVASILIAQGDVFRTSLAIIPFVLLVPLGVGLFIWLVIWKSILKREKV